MEEQKEPIMLEYWNLGSYKYAKLTIEPGKLTIIRGENNNGKSILIYAMTDLLLNNPRAKTYINSDALAKDPNTELIMKISQGTTTVEAHRSMNDMYYVVNGGKPIRKLNKANVFQKIENLSVPGITYLPNVDTPLFNVHDEDRGMFPLDHNDQSIFGLFERLLGLINSKKIISIVQKEIATAKTQYEMLHETIASSELRLNQVSTAIDRIDATAIDSMIQNIKSLQNAQISLSTAYDTVHMINSSIPTVIPEQTDISNCNDLFNNLKVLSTAADRIVKLSTQINSVHECSVQSTESLKNAIESYKQLDSVYSQCKHILNELDLLDQSEVQVNEQLKDLKDQLNQMKVCPLCGHTL